jgi:hypothetical protein
MIVFCVLCLCAAAFALFMGTIRNEWVFRQRQKILKEDHEAFQQKIDNGAVKCGEPFHPRYDALPSYDSMMWRLWVWNISRWL